ncbi:MAG: thermonuclease family protein [Tabrizicola sp.]|jgi:endonuclease YncB( thermonuclease family)|nr:thermonuclease family protein [Tabrizicola sp.]
MARRRGDVVPYSRSYRRPPRWGMGLPPHRPPGPVTRFLRRIVNPLFYLKAVIGLGLFGLLILPTIADGINAATKTVQVADGQCRIIRVVDGDTVTLLCDEDGIQSARLMGYDTPEKYAPNCMAEFVAAEQASWALRTILRKADRLEISQDGTDQYGRALVTLRVDGQDVARLMIRAGHARQYGGGPRGSWC